MLTILNLITNNYFLKQKLKVPKVNSSTRRITDTWQGNIENGKKIIDGKLGPDKIVNFNKFLFLRDLRSEGSINSRAIARSLVINWIEKKHGLLSSEFNSKVMASRVTLWCFSYSWFAESGESSFQSKLLQSIAFQTKYLELKLKEANDNLEKIILIKGIIIGQSILYEDVESINNLISLIDEALLYLINEDGGHVSRSPVLQIELLRHLVEIRSVIAILKNIDAETLHKKTLKMGEFCRSFQMPNGNFAWFNGGSLVSKDLIKQTLDRIGYKNKIFSMAKQTGFCRLSNQESVVFIDVGIKENLIRKSKASLFSFEFYFQKQKIISNLGDLVKPNSQNAVSSLASSAAHSTLSIDDRNNIDLSGNRKTKILSLEYGKTKKGSLIDISHSGYELIYGVTHRRQIYLSQNKNELRGKDEILNIKNLGSIPKNADIRFHLHPDIDAVKVRDGSVLLKHKKGFIWKMITNNKNINIQNSIMFFPSNQIACKQIIIKIKLDNIRSNKIESCNWAFELQK